MSARTGSEKIKSKKFWINTIFSLIGIGIVLLYSICGEACSYLKGSIFSIDLKYLGILFMGLILIFNLLRKDAIILLLLSFGLGAEIYFIGFQISNSIYCYYCLAFGAATLFLFFVNLDMSKKAFVGIFLILGFILFLIFFEGNVTPLYAENPSNTDLLPSFGNGKIKVRLYTDYFCGPCRSIEQRLEKVITDLVEKGIISITFIDTPVHKHTHLYARYFLYVLNKNKELKKSLSARSVLFEAAELKITEEKRLKEFLKKKGIRFSPIDVKPTFTIFNTYLKKDRVDATPTCVIFDGENKSYKGTEDIMKALERLSR